MDTECPVSLENSYTIQFDSQNIKTELMKVILQEKSCTQTEMAKILGVDQTKVSYIRNLHTYGFSLSRLLSFILKLGCDVDLKINNLKTIKIDHNTKLELLHLIKNIIAKYNLSQEEIGKLTKIHQSNISLINRLRTDRFALEFLLTLLVRMDCKVEFVVKKPTSEA